MCKAAKQKHGGADMGATKPAVVSGGKPSVKALRTRLCLVRHASVFAIIGIWLVAGIISAGPGWREFWTNRNIRLWHLLIAAQPPLWAATMIGVWDDFAACWEKWKCSAATWITAVFALFATGAMTMGPFLVLKEFKLQTFGEYLHMPFATGKMFAIMVGGAVVATFHVWGLAAIHAELASTDVDLPTYLQARTRAQRFVSALGLIIAAACLSTGALRNAVDSLPNAVNSSSSLFSGDLALAYGAYFTILLAAIYVPVHRALQDAGRRLAEKYLKVEQEIPQDIERAVRRKAAVEKLLGLGYGSTAALRSGLAIIAPLVSVLATLLLLKEK